MERRTSRSLSELAEAGEEKSLLGKEVEKLTGISSLDTLVPEEEVEAPLSTNQENFKAGVVRRRSQRKAVTRQNTFSDGDWTDSSLSPSSRPFFSAVQSPSSSYPQASATPSLSEFEDCHSTLATAPDTPDCAGPRSTKESLIPSQQHRKLSDFDMELPPLELFYGPHLQFLPEGDTETPDENDLFPSTPLDEEQLKHADSRLKEELGDVVINEQLETVEEELQWSDIPWMDPRWLDPRPAMYNAADQAEIFAMNMWHKFQGYKVVAFASLPQWLQDNDYLRKGHRPPLPSFLECFKSIFRIHTETGNIWTHLLGQVAFIGLAVYFMTRPSTEIDIQEKMVFMTFFAGAIVCMCMSFIFHTVNCHQNKFIGQVFAKLDYCGIAFLIVGSFVPWLYYSFYCDYTPKVIYLTIVVVMGVTCVIVSLWDKFGSPRLRPFRAGIFITFGLSGIAPATHYSIQNGWEKSINEAALGWLVFMGFLYISGAMLYAFRIPERFFPGKVDILFHSHQLFHCFVIAGAFVHYHGISNMALHRLHAGECPQPKIDLSLYV